MKLNKHTRNLLDYFFAQDCEREDLVNELSQSDNLDDDKSIIKEAKNTIYYSALVLLLGAKGANFHIKEIIKESRK